jgi:hypothetical protein
MSITLFHETYTALVATLVSTYPGEARCAHNYKLYHSPKEDDRKNLYNEWVDQVNPHYQLIIEKNETLFTKSLMVVTDTGIMHLWKRGIFTTASKQYIWAYLQKLCEFSGACNTLDINPPPNSSNNAPTGTLQDTFMKLFESLPADIVNNVHQMTEQVSSNLSSDDVNYSDIASQLLKNIDPVQIAGVLQKVGGILQTNNGDISKFTPGNIQDLVANVQNICKQTGSDNSIIDID